MALAPLPASNTARYKLNYSNVIHPHTTIIRAAGAHSPANVGAQLDVLLTALSPILAKTTFVSLEYAPVGSDIFNPVVCGFEGTQYGPTDANVSNAPWFYGFVGRTSGGRKIRFEIYGAQQLGVNYRFSPGEDINIDAAVLVPQASANAWVGIDGLKPVWYSYANVTVSGYWQRKAR